MDIDGDGVLSPDEIKTLLIGLGTDANDEQVSNLIAKCDENGDG